MAVPKGGRGIKAPYTTKTLRIPSPLVPHVRRLIEAFHGVDSDDEIQELPELDRALAEAGRILKSRKSAKWSMTQLLKRLYKTENIEL